MNYSIKIVYSKNILIHFSVARWNNEYDICIKIKEMTFKELHYQNKPLIIGNVWGVPSAKVAEKLGIQAIATSSWAVAAILGYEDGENISFSELEYIVKRIAKNTNLLFDRLNDFYGKALEAFEKLSKDIKHAEPEELFMDSEIFRKQLE